MTRRISHDAARCAGLGVCEGIAPEFFEVGGNGALTVLRSEVDAQDEALIEDAIYSCPTQALSWAE